MIEPKTRISHVVDILGNVIGRDQPIMLMDKAIQLINLLDDNVFESDEYVFFDPFCKAGEILLACAYIRCFRKANYVNGFLDVNDIKNELYESNRYFALSPDERHHKLSLRTFLGNEKSHNKKLNNIIRDGHYLSELTGKLDKEKFHRELESMLEYIKEKSSGKKIIAVGNPPYQESDGGHGGSATLIYPHFVSQVKSRDGIEKMLFVLPARWFSVGKNLDSFRHEILKERNIKELVYFERSEDVFPTVHVQGGICFFSWERNHKKDAIFKSNNKSFKLPLNQFDIIPDDPSAGPIIKKILNDWDGQFYSDYAWSRKPFGLPTNYFKKNTEVGKEKGIKCLTQRKTVRYVSQHEIKKNLDKIEMWKVAIPKAYATGARRCTLPAHQIFLIEKDCVCVETYNIISAFKTQQEAENVIKYLRTDFCRYLLGLRKLTQDIPKDRWKWVPYLDPSKEWNDQEIYKMFNITKDEQEHIKRKIEEWS